MKARIDRLLTRSTRALTVGSERANDEEEIFIERAARSSPDTQIQFSVVVSDLLSYKYADVVTLLGTCSTT